MQVFLGVGRTCTLVCPLLLSQDELKMEYGVEFRDDSSILLSLHSFMRPSSWESWTSSNGRPGNLCLWHSWGVVG